jgi:hypothetical protein
MSTTMDDIEAGLRELFERQAESVSVGARTWDDPPMASVVELPQPRRSRSALAAIMATAAAIALVVALAVIGSGSGVRVAGQPGSPAPVLFSTPQVSFAADAMLIEADGEGFTAGGSAVDVHSDPGTRNAYTTLELTWHERGVEMRLFVYFKSDGHDWWSDEIRTYNGKSPADWIEYHGSYFRTPLGQPYTGDVDLAATVGNGHLRITNLRLQAFLPLAACTNPTGKYAFDIGYDHVNMPNDPMSGFGLGTPTLLDTATCAPVANAHAFTITLTLDPPGIAGIEATDGKLADVADDVDPSASIQLAPERKGTAVLHAVARERSTNKVVAATEIPVTVG